VSAASSPVSEFPGDQSTAADTGNPKTVAATAALSRFRSTWNSFNRVGHSIGLRLLIRVLLFSCAVTLILTLLQLYLDYRHDVRAIETRMSEIGVGYLQSLGEGLWNLDSQQLELQIEGILRLPAIRFVEVRHTTDRGGSMVVSGGHPATDAALRREFPISHTSRGERQQLGVLSIEATLDDVYRALFERAIVILASQGATIFLVSFFILYITHRLITRRLTALAGFLGKYDLRRPPPPLRLQRREPSDEDELDQLVAAFEKMRQSLERAYNDLRESEKRFRDYAETESDWFWTTGPEHNFTYFSDHVDAFGVNSGQLIGKRIWEIATDFSPEADNWREHMGALERHAPFRDFVFTAQCVDGSLSFVSISGKPVFNSEGGFSGYCGVARDITERKRVQDALEHAQSELAHVTRVATLGEMTASIAHEVNQPLCALVNNASACLGWLDAGKPEEARKSITFMVNDAHRASEIITRIRALVKKAPPQKDWLVINQIVREVIALAQSEVQRNHVALETQLSDDLPPVFADRIQLQQVMLNLMMNAIEAVTQVTGPRELLICSRADDSKGVVVVVRDSGPGLSSKSLERLFEPFYTTKPQGMGMGLAICRSIVEAHGGKLWAIDNEEQGATFQFTLPTGSDRPARVK
jgi:PAS domain S-box-containing protein